MKLSVIEGLDCYFLGGHGFLGQYVVNSHASDHLDILTYLDFLKGFMALFFGAFPHFLGVEFFLFFVMSMHHFFHEL